MHHGIATAIASDFLNRRRNRKGSLQWEANLAFFIAKRIATATTSLPQKKSPPRIWRSLWATLAVVQRRWPYIEYNPEKHRCVQFWQRKRIADFDHKSSLGDGAPNSLNDPCFNGLMVNDIATSNSHWSLNSVGERLPRKPISIVKLPLYGSPKIARSDDLVTSNSYLGCCKMPWPSREQKKKMLFRRFAPPSRL